MTFAESVTNFVISTVSINDLASRNARTSGAYFTNTNFNPSMDK